MSTVLNYLDRNTLGIMWQSVVRDLGLVDPALPETEYMAHSKDLYAMINMAFIIAYGVSQMFSGKFYDKIGTKMGFTCSAILWGVADALTAVAGGVRSLIFTRTALGLGVAGPWPGAVKNNAEWFHSHEKAFAQGIFKAGSCVGAFLAPILIAPMCLVFGWKATFVIVGGLSLIWIIPWLILSKKVPNCPDQERKVGWKSMLRTRKSYALILGRLFLDPIWMMFSTWIPIYLLDVYDFNIKEIGSIAWIPYVGAILGSCLGGWMSGRLIKMRKSIRFARLSTIVTGAAMMFPTMIYVAFVDQPLVAVGCMAIILFGYQFSMTNIQTLASDMYSGDNVGSIAGLGGTSATIGTLGMTALIPYLTSGSDWSPFFIAATVLIPLSTLSIFIFLRKEDINIQPKEI